MRSTQYIYIHVIQVIVFILQWTMDSENSKGKAAKAKEKKKGAKKASSSGSSSEESGETSSGGE